MEIDVDDRSADLPQPSRLLERPIFIIGCNRSGTTLLHRNLAEHTRTWSSYTESKTVFHALWPIDPAEGDRVDRAATAHESAALRRMLYRRARNKQVLAGRPLLGSVPEKLLNPPVDAVFKSPPVRLVEKTPSNCFRVPLLASLWPDARFVFIVRAPEPTISSLMEGWKRWNGYDGGRVRQWTYLAPPGWRNRAERPLREIAAWQWRSANRTAWDDLEEHGCDYAIVRHEDLVRTPEPAYRSLLDFAELEWTDHFESLLDELGDRVWTNRGSPPEREKWKRLHGEEVAATREMWAPLKQELWEGAARAGAVAA